MKLWIQNQSESLLFIDESDGEWSKRDECGINNQPMAKCHFSRCERMKVEYILMNVPINDIRWNFKFMKWNVGGRKNELNATWLNAQGHVRCIECLVGRTYPFRGIFKFGRIFPYDAMLREIRRLNNSKEMIYWCKLQNL